MLVGRKSLKKIACLGIIYMKDFEILEIEYMITAELTRKINLLPQESYSMVENFVEQLIDANNRRDSAFKTFMEKMDTAEKSVQEHGYLSEEEVEEELAKI